MKPLILEIAGVGIRGNEVYDFRTKSSNLAAVISSGTANIRELLSFAIFGGGDSGRLTYTYELDGEEYTVVRNFSEKTATLSGADGVLAEDEAAVTAYISDKLGASKELFEAFSFIDRDACFDAFTGTDDARSAFIDSLLSVLSDDRSEVFGNKKAAEAELERLLVKKELTGEYDADEAALIKNEIEKNNAKKDGLLEKLSLLEKQIADAEDTERLRAELQKAEDELAAIIANQGEIEACRTRLANSGRAENLYTLWEKKDEIEEEKTVVQQKADELNAEISDLEKIIEKGSVTKKDTEDAVVHCIERLAMLREVLYGRVEGFASDEKVAEEIEKIYAEEESNILVFTERKKTVDEEYKATELTYNELAEKYALIAPSPDLKIAIREGAVVETAMRFIEEEMTALNLNIEKCNTRMSEIQPKTVQLKEDIADGKKLLTSLRKQFIGNARTKEDAINNAAVRKQELYTAHITALTNEKESEALEVKIQQNISGLNSYFEDMEALESAKQGLVDYISKIKDKLAVMESEILDTKSRFIYAEKINDIEFGEKCPVCRSVVLSKTDTEDEKKLSIKISKIQKEIDKGNGIIAEYDEKLLAVSNRMGELSARIRTSEAYIASLNESVDIRKNNISKILAQYGAEDTATLTKMLKEAIAHSNMLLKLGQDIYILEGTLLSQESCLEIYAEEIKRIEEVELPGYVAKFNALSVRLGEYKNVHEELEKLLGDKTALEWTEELSIVEKEMATLEDSINEKREKMLSLLSEKEQLNDMLISMSNRDRIIRIDDEDCNYRQVIAKVLTREAAEIIAEIKKSDEEVEQLKVELTAIRRVLAKSENAQAAAKEALAEVEAVMAKQDAVIESIFAGGEEEAKALDVSDKEGVRALMLTEESKENMVIKIASFDEARAVAVKNIERIVALYDTEAAGEGSDIEAMKEESVSVRKDIDTCLQANAELVVKRSELKEKALFLSRLKNETEKCRDRIKFLEDVCEVVESNAEFSKYLIKKTGKLIASLSSEKYALLFEGGELKLENKEKGKIIAPAEFNTEEALLVALALGTQVYGTALEMTSKSGFSPAFFIKDAESDKASARTLVSYCKNRQLLAVSSDKGFMKALDKVLL